jgi:hypothetical protein
MRKVFWAVCCAFTLIFSVSAVAQNNHGVCGTHPDASIEMTIKAKAMIENGYVAPRGVVTYVPVKYHLVARTNGTGRVKETDVYKMHCHLNEVYEDQEIQFFLKDGEFNYINNNTVYDNHVGTQGTIMNFNKDDEAMNVFIVDDATPAGGGQSPGTVLGYYSPQRDWIVMRIDQVNSNSQTLPHEAGHFFGLPHPFRGYEPDPFDNPDAGWPIAPVVSPNGSTPTELQDGSNCSTAGDFICDTPPDYNFGLINGTSCVYSGGAKDPNGVTVNPDETLIMSYFNDNCVNKFSDDQKDIVAANLASTDRNFLDNSYSPPAQTVSNDLVPIYPQNMASIPVFDNELNIDWEDMDGATSYVFEIATNQFFSDVETHIVNESYVELTGIERLKTYYWRVKAFNWTNTCAASIASATMRFTTDKVMNTNKIDFVSYYNVFPNPANTSSGVNLYLNSKQSFTGTINLYNLTGQLSYQMKHNFQPGGNAVRLEGLQLEQGVYMIRVQTDYGILSSKVVINN